MPSRLSVRTLPDHGLREKKGRVFKIQKLPLSEDNLVAFLAQPKFMILTDITLIVAKILSKSFEYYK